MQAIGLKFFVLLTLASDSAYLSTWKMGSRPSCTLSRKYSDGSSLIIQQGQAIFLTATKLNWSKSLSKSRKRTLTLQFGGGGFGHFRTVTAMRVYREGCCQSDANSSLIDALILKSAKA